MNENPVLECSHYWKIPSPEGPTSVGVCRDCGEQREFKNVLDDSDQYDWNHPAQLLGSFAPDPTYVKGMGRKGLGGSWYDG